MDTPSPAGGASRGGLIMTPMQIVRGITSMVSQVDPNQPSAELLSRVRMELAARRAALTDPALG